MFSEVKTGDFARPAFLRSNDSVFSELFQKSVPFALLLKPVFDPYNIRPKQAGEVV
jgi:hypothetical protein